MMTFNSLAAASASGVGALNFFGDTHIQSHVPLKANDPEVSIFVSKPAVCNCHVNSSRLCISGSPPVITANLPGCADACSTISFITILGCLSASQLSFTSHQKHPTLQPPKRIK